MIHKAWCDIEEVPYYFSRTYIKFQGHTGWKIDDLDQIWARLLGRSQLSNPSDLPCLPCSHDCIIMKFSGVITNDKSDVHAKGQGQRSKVKVTEVKIQFSRFWTITPVWIHIWWWNDAQSLVLLGRGALLCFQGHSWNFKVTQLKKKFVDFDPNWAFPDCNSRLHTPMATKWCIKLEVA